MIIQYKILLNISMYKKIKWKNTIKMQLKLYWNIIALQVFFIIIKLIYFQDCIYLF